MGRCKKKHSSRALTRASILRGHPNPSSVLLSYGWWREPLLDGWGSSSLPPPPGLASRTDLVVTRALPRTLLALLAVRHIRQLPCTPPDRDIMRAELLHTVGALRPRLLRPSSLVSRVPWRLPEAPARADRGTSVQPESRVLVGEERAGHQPPELRYHP
jgi:hypothetical protein